MTEHPEFPSSTIALLAKKIKGAAIGQDYVDWAVQALTEGFDSPNLSILASLDIETDFSLWEAEKYFRNVVAELGWSFPDDETVLRNHLTTLITHIQNGILDPETGVDRIHREVISPLNHPSDLHGWCLLWEGNNPSDYAMIPKEEYASKILAYAQEWITEKK